MAGWFIIEAEQEMYCKILSIIETCKHKGGKIFEKIIQVFANQTYLCLIGLFGKLMSE